MNTQTPVVQANVADDIAVNLIENAEENNMHPKTAVSKRCQCTLPIVALAVFVLGVAVIGFKQGQSYALTNSNIAIAESHVALMINTSADVCNSWQYLCDGYTNSHFAGQSVLHDFQKEIHAQIVPFFSQMPKSEFSQFYGKCMTANLNYDLQEHKVTHLQAWKRGLASNNVQFFQKIELQDGTIAPGVLIDSDVNTPSEYAIQITAADTTVHTPQNCTAVQVLQLASQILNRHSVQMLISNQPLDIVCQHVANQTQFAKKTYPAATSQECFSATAALWPAAISHVYETYVANKYAHHDIFARAYALATKVQNKIVDTLHKNDYTNLAKKIEQINVHVHYAGVAETYGTVNFNITFAELCVLLQTKQFLLSAQDVADPMAAFTLNAYYRGLQNDVHITAGMLHYAAHYSGNSDALLYGKLGFVLAHEFAHALDGTGIWYTNDGEYQIGTILQSKANANKYAGDTECLKQEFETDGRTTNEDVADFIGISVMKSLVYELPDTTTLNVCAPECVHFDAVQTFYAGFAQTWCSGYKSPYNVDDVHSPGKERVVHAMLTMHAATVFGCSAENEVQNTCSIIGFSANM